MATTIHDALSGGGARPPVLHCLAAAVLGIGVFALVVGAEPAFATHEGGEIRLRLQDTITDNNMLHLTELWNLETIKIGDKYYIMTGGRGNSDRGFQVLEITDPTNIRAAGQLNDTGATALRNNLGLVFHQIGTSIYALTTSYSEKGMQITNVTDPSNPTAVSKVTYGDCGGENPAIRNAAAVQIGDYHYAMALSTQCDKFHWVNITNTTHPTNLFTGSTSTNTPTNRAVDTNFVRLESPVNLFFRQVGSEHFAYIGGADGVQIVDVTDPTALRAEGFMANLQNEPRDMKLHQVGSKSYLIASIGSDHNPEIQIHNITDTPMHSTYKDGVDKRISTVTLERNLQGFDIFEMEGRTYLAVAFDTGHGVSFVDITDPARPFEVKRIKDGTHGFNLLHTPRDATAIKIDGQQYVAVGGDEGISMIHVRPHAPVIDVKTTSSIVSNGDGSYNATVASGQNLTISIRPTAQPSSSPGSSVLFYVQMSVYQDGSRVPSYITDRDASRVSFTSNNWNMYKDRTFPTSNLNWDQEYAIITIYTQSSQLGFTGRAVTGIYVTGSSQSSPSTQEEGALRLPTALTLSLGQATVGEDIGTVSITATLDAPAPPDGVSVSLYSSGGNATDGTDYTLPASIYIAAGERSGSASITITDDAVAESDESVTISTYVDIFGQEMTDSVTLTITDDDGVAAVADQENQPPTISSAISDVTIPHETGTRTISLSGVFSDADSDQLNITATSSDAATAAVSVSSDHASMTLTAQARGISTITVTADDGNGGTISDTFTVVVKAAPTVSSAISDISGMSIGDNRDISLASVFSDADSDPLNITASTSDYNIAEAIIFQDTLTIIAVSNGSATITVTAQDTDGNRAADTFEVTVAAAQQQDNRAPTISSAISDVTIVREDGVRTISLSGVFSDADSDSLDVTATSSDATKAAVSVSSDHTSLTLTAKARGISTITVTADDGNGGTISDTFTVVVKAAPTISSAISDVSGLTAGDSRTVSLDGVFDDTDGDSLVITTASSNGSVATVEAASDGSALTITAQAPGTTTITVTAQDADGNQAADTFEVTVAQQTADTPEPESIVAQYDTDGSGIIEQDEWEIAIQDYTDGKLTNEEIFAISQARP